MKLGVYWEIIKAIVFISVLIALVFGSFQIYSWFNGKMAIQQAQIELALSEARQAKQYSDNLVRAQTEIVNSLKDQIKGLGTVWDVVLADMKKSNEEITNIGETIAKLEDNIRKLNTESSHEYKAGTGDPNEQYFIDIMYPVKNEKGEVIKEIPYAWAIFYPNRTENQWKYGIYQLDYKSEVIQSEQRDGQINTYTKIWFENNKRKQSKGYEVPITISSSQYSQLKKETTEFYWWAPHISLNLDATYSSETDMIGAGGLSINLMGYGRTKNDLIWKFVEFGASTNGDDTYFKFSPVAYNIGEHIPLVSNTFLGPFVGYSIDGDTMFGLSLSVPF